MFRARRFLSAFAFVVILGPGDSYAADAKSALAQRPDVAAALEVFDTWVDWTARNRDQPAVSIGIVYDQELVFAKGYGYADIAKKTPATPATAYRIASISKTFTAHAILQLRDAGKLQLDDPITKWIPELKLAKIDPQQPGHHDPADPVPHRRHSARGRRDLLERHELPLARGHDAHPQPHGRRRPLGDGIEVLQRRARPCGLHRRGRFGRAVSRVRRAPHPGAARHDRHAGPPHSRHADARGRLRPAHGGQAPPPRALLQRQLHARRVELRLDRRGSREVRVPPVPHGGPPEGRRSSRPRRSPRCSASNGSSRTGRAAGGWAGASVAATD